MGRKSPKIVKLQVHHFLPLPVITCWGTWMDATVYYAEKFELFYSVVSDLHRDDIFCIAMLQEMCNDSKSKC
jgi:hypothetical protein